MFKRFGKNNVSIFIIGQDYYELPKQTSRAKGNMYHIFKPNELRFFQNRYQDKASMDLAPNDYKLITSTCWNKRYPRLTIDFIEDENTGGRRLGLDSSFVPDSSLF